MQITDFEVIDHGVLAAEPECDEGKFAFVITHNGADFDEAAREATYTISGEAHEESGLDFDWEEFQKRIKPEGLGEDKGGPHGERNYYVSIRYNKSAEIETHIYKVMLGNEAIYIGADYEEALDRADDCSLAIRAKMVPSEKLSILSDDRPFWKYI